MNLGDDYLLSLAKYNEIDAIQEIASEGKLFNYPKFLLRWLINRKRIYTLRKAGTLIAYFSFVTVPQASKTYLLQIGIKAAHRGKGLGTKLLSLLCTKARRDHKSDTILAHTLKPRVAKLFCRQNWEILFRVLGVFLVKKKLS